MLPSLTNLQRHGISLASKLLACLVLFGLLAAGLQLLKAHYVGLGEAQERARWEQRERQAEREAHEAYAENVRLGKRYAQAQLGDERQARRHADQLNMERRHATLTLAEPHCMPPLARSDLRAPGPAGPGLTADAVRLWNSALAGHDVPAGACGAGGAPADACAADAGLTVADAWDNQAANALSCRIDRQRLNHLIDYLQQP